MDFSRIFAWAHYFGVKSLDRWEVQEIEELCLLNTFPVVHKFTSSQVHKT
jgi:hypothetical protein